MAKIKTNDSVRDLKECPECKASWQGEPIPQEYIDQGLYQKGLTHYSLLRGIEYGYPHPERYDGISEWQCPFCSTRWGRWTNKILAEGEDEKRYGGR